MFEEMFNKNEFMGGGNFNVKCLTFILLEPKVIIFYHQYLDIPKIDNEQFQKMKGV